MNNNLKNIPKQFLKNSSFDSNYNTEIYIASTQNNKKNTSNYNIWFLIIILILFDII